VRPLPVPHYPPSHNDKITDTAQVKSPLLGQVKCTVNEADEACFGVQQTAKAEKNPMKSRMDDEWRRPDPVLDFPQQRELRCNFSTRRFIVLHAPRRE
jgi:hypothetical protein